MRRYEKTLGMLAVLGLLIVLPALGPPAAAQGTPAVSCPEGSGEAPDGPVRIGVILPLSGTAASVGTDEQAALRLAVELINQDRPEVALPLAAGTGLPNL